MPSRNFLNLTADLNINREALLAATGNQVLTGRNVQAAAELLYITANHFANQHNYPAAKKGIKRAAVQAG